MRQTETKEWLKYSFSDAEQREHARQLARSTRELAQVELQKKEVVSALKARAEAQNSEIARLSEFINNGYEYRNIECEIRYDTPDIGWKTIVRVDTGEIVREMKMDEFDKQEELALEGAKQ